MGAARWTTPEQVDFLKQWLPSYEEHSGPDGDYERFWTALFPAWFQKWPAEDNGQRPNPFMIACQKQLKTWFRWRLNASRTNRQQQKRTTTVFDKAIKPKGSRVLSPAELYSIQYYEERIKPRIKADQEAGILNTRGEVLAASRKLARELLEAEDDAVKQEIQELYLKQKKSRSADSDAAQTTDPYELQRAIDDLPYALTRVAELVKRRTGFAVSFMCAGPDPSRNWEITSLSCHPDETPQGHSFSALFPKQENDMLSAFQDYAEALFPPETRDPSHRTCESMEGDHADEGASASEAFDPEDETDVEIGVAYPSVEVEDVGLEDEEGSEGRGGDSEVATTNDLEENMGESVGDASLLSAECVVSAERSTLSSHASSTSGISAIQNTSLTDPCYDFNLEGMDLGHHAMTSFQIPPDVAQSSMPFAGPSLMPFASYGNPASSFTSHGPVVHNPVSFSGAMHTINANLPDDGWNFMGIGLDNIGTQLLPSLDTTGLGDRPLPLLPPPALSQDSPTRPRLPAVPPLSPPVVVEAGKSAKTHPKKGKGKRPVAPAKPDAMPVAAMVSKASKVKRSNTTISSAGSDNVAAPTASKAKRSNAAEGTVSTSTPPDLATIPRLVTTTGARQDPNHTIVARTQAEPSGEAPLPVPSQQPSNVSPPASRVSKRVPVQSKRNMVADAIGTNQPTFASGVNANQQVPSAKRKGKRVAADTTQETTKRKKKSKELQS